MDNDVKARLDAFDKLVELLLQANDSDSSGDHRERVWSGLEAIKPFLVSGEIVAPADGVVGALEVADGDRLCSWRKSDPLMKVGNETVSAGNVGVVEKVLVKAGDVVKAGQPLIRYNRYLRAGA